MSANFIMNTIGDICLGYFFLESSTKSDQILIIRTRKKDIV